MKRSFAAQVLVVAGLSAVALTGCSTKGGSSATGGTGTAAKAPLSSVKVALVPGGAHPYFQPWKTAGQKAKADFGLGAMTFSETAEWNQSKQNSLLDSLAAQGYNAFGIFGVSPTDINSTFAELKSKGSAVASLGSCPAGDVDKADFCLATDVEQAAYKAAQAGIKAMGGHGTLVHLTGNNVDSNTQRRIAGVKKAVAETNGQVKLLTTITDVDTDLQTAQRAVSDLLTAHGTQITGIVSTAYNPAVAAAAAVKRGNRPIKVVAIDDDPKILAGISDGSVAATVTQNPVGQAYVGSWALGQLRSGACTVRTPGTAVDSGSFVVTHDNVTTYDQERQAKTQQLLKTFKDTVLSCA
ncbi:sugar ABC transporter substrate-binding protein [Actinoallomurus purpureus]|uniref:sugar ABC transporter substrate-binding protein n=1 Tax=Actinoallomurus purpureus TaxID=478114 RepID=UPI002093720C|nr:sugar ABC transporter substrate-binding protein [Actinoallomurus purpureus]MCO6007983.1 sugar ABC transporter substrate-binding protein [Actinoallomurus purpureus]